MRIRLKTRAFIGGKICQRGEIATLPDGVRGPCKVVNAFQNHDPLQPVDTNLTRESDDVALFDFVSDEPERHSDEQKAAADLAAAHRKKSLERAASQ